MNLTEFQPLIAALPVELQAFRSKRKNWDRFNGNPVIAPLINELFGESKELILSRSDIRGYANRNTYGLFVMATIVWGYPRGMRGNHVGNIGERMQYLVEILENSANGINDWDKHYSGIDITGLGLSTYTKFIHFLGVRVEGLPSLILDDRLIKVAKRETFEELSTLNGLRSHNAAQRYVSYLQIMNDVAGRIGVTAEQLELFLFTFGGNLKPIHAQQAAPVDVGADASPRLS
jgi:hypothetical protein